jgi:hypothetical protein
MKESILIEGRANREVFKPGLARDVHGFHTDALAWVSNHAALLFEVKH